MPPNRTSSQQIFDTNLLDPRALAAPGGLQTALDSMERVCYHDDSSIVGMIVGLSSHSHLLEYTLSGTLYLPMNSMRLIKQTALVALDDQAYERLSKWMVAQFPAPATPNATEALGIKVLQQLSSSLVSVEEISTAEHRKELRAFRGKAGLSLNVLKEIGGCADRASVDVNVSPTSRKRPKLPARHVQLDPHPFDCMGITVPVTEDEVRAVSGNVLSQLQNILRVSVFISLRLAPKHSHTPSTTYLS